MLLCRRLFSVGFGKQFSSMALPTYETLALSQPSSYVVNVQLNRPKTRNSMNLKVWTEIGQCFTHLSTFPDCRAIILSGAGKVFCSGLDFKEMMTFAQIASDTEKDVSRRAWQLRPLIKQIQECFDAVEKCPKPVIASIHGAALGAAVDLTSACDIRYATEDAIFSIKEIFLGIVSDIGTLQRLPKITGNDSLVRELTYSTRDFDAKDALKFGMVSRVFPNAEELQTASLSLAQTIASRSPVAVQGTKINLNYSRDHTTQESLDFAANWNMCHIQSEDVVVAASAAATRQKEAPTFSKL